MKILQKPWAKTALVVVAVIVALNFLKPYTAKVPVVGKYL